MNFRWEFKKSEDDAYHYSKNKDFKYINDRFVSISLILSRILLQSLVNLRDFENFVVYYLKLEKLFQFVDCQKKYFSFTADSSVKSAPLSKAVFLVLFQTLLTIFLYDFSNIS